MNQIITSANQVTGCTIAPPSEVERQVADIEQVIQRLSCISSRFATRLVSVMNGGQPDCASPANPQMQVLCPHGEILRAKVNSLNSIAASMEKTLNRIEL